MLAVLALESCRRTRQLTGVTGQAASVIASHCAARRDVQLQPAQEGERSSRPHCGAALPGRTVTTLIITVTVTTVAGGPGPIHPVYSQPPTEHRPRFRFRPEIPSSREMCLFRRPKNRSPYGDRFFSGFFWWFLARSGTRFRRGLAEQDSGAPSVTFLYHCTDARDRFGPARRGVEVVGVISSTGVLRA